MSEKNGAKNPVNVVVTFRHTDPTDALKTYATEKVTHCVQKFLSAAGVEAHVTLSCEKRDQIAEVYLHQPGPDLKAKAVSADLYSSIDLVVDNLTAQLRKAKERQTDHHHEHAKLATTLEYTPPE